MFLLPKGSPLFENLAASKLKLPEVLSKLSTAAFTGYASFIFPATTTLLVFESGKLVSIQQEDQRGEQKNGFEALTELAEKIVTSTSGTLNVYKLSKDLTACIHSLLQGEILYKAQELKLIDIKSLLDKIKSDQMNGCLRIYTADRSAMIFYKEGNPLGFFHDGSQDIETSSVESQKIATMPGAKIDLYSTQGAEALMDMDLLQVTNVQTIWDTAVERQQSESAKVSQERQERDRKIMALKLNDLEEQLKTIVSEYCGKVGRAMVDKELSDQGGNFCIIDENGAAKLLAGIERGAKLLISATNIRAMMEKLTNLVQTAQSDL